MRRRISAGRRAYHAVLFTALGVALIAQLCLLFVLPVGGTRWLVAVGWALFAFSAVLGWLPILTFRLRGRVAKGKSYIHTTELVTSGIYSIVRHPQFFAADLLAAAVMCIAQHWSVVAAGVVAVATNHLTMQKADDDLVDKFGDPYRDYMRRVPRWNLATGIFRRLRSGRTTLRQERNDV